MRRFWIDSKDVQDNQLHLKDDLFHHVFKVCRFQKGQKLHLVSQGMKYLAQIQEVSKKEATASIIQKVFLPPLAKPRIHLALACPKFSVLENLLPKCVELGVSDFHLFLSEFSFVRKEESISSNRFQRWEKIIQQAVSQSLSPQEMRLHEAQSLTEILNTFLQTKNSKGFFFYEGENGLKASKDLRQLTEQNLDDVWIFLGSEGGFSLQEVSIFESYGMNPLTLGSQILKVETACLTILGVLKYILRQL